MGDARQPGMFVLVPLGPAISHTMNSSVKDAQQG
jgi:hypothetical protein